MLYFSSSNNYLGCDCFVLHTTLCDANYSSTLSCNKIVDKIKSKTEKLNNLRLQSRKKLKLEKVFENVERSLFKVVRFY